MNKYYITEVQNFNSTGAGSWVKCENLEAAKKWADDNQYFERTCLKIEDEDDDLLAYRDES